MSNSNSVALFIAVLLGIQVVAIYGHGYLYDPPGRSSVWRLFPQAPVNTADDAVFCGSFESQYNSVNQGRCGECGDEWSSQRPRDNEEGGKYGKDVIITQRYAKGNIVPMTAFLITAHSGYFKLNLCAKNSADELVMQECFDKFPLKFADGSDRFYVGENEGWYYMNVQLPADVTCENCVIQWTWTTGNKIGDCGDGTEALGCGNQETFRNCADVSIF